MVVARAGSRARVALAVVELVPAAVLRARAGLRACALGCAMRPTCTRCGRPRSESRTGLTTHFQCFYPPALQDDLWWLKGSFPALTEARLAPDLGIPPWLLRQQLEAARLRQQLEAAQARRRQLEAARLLRQQLKDARLRRQQDAPTMVVR